MATGNAACVPDMTRDQQAESPCTRCLRSPRPEKGQGGRGDAGSPKKNVETGFQNTNRYVYETILQRVVKAPVGMAEIIGHVGCHLFRHPFATHLLEERDFIRATKEFLGHKDAGMTRIPTSILNKEGFWVGSPSSGL